MKTTYLNIHDFITIRVNQKNGREYIKDINQPLSYFETPNVENPDIVMNIGDFEPQLGKCTLVDHKYHIRDGYLFCAESIQRIPFTVEINNLESFPTIVNVHIKTRKLKQYISPSALAQNIFLRPIIDFKLLQRGVVSVHAAGVVGDRGAVVLLGRGGTYKTTVEMDLIRKKGYRFLGDDRILISQGQVFCYPIHYRVFEFRTQKMATEDYRRFDKLRYLIYQGRRQKISDVIAESSPLVRTLCMVKHTGQHFMARQLEGEDLIRKTVKSQMLEYIKSPVLMGISEGKLYELISAYSFIFPKSLVASYWTSYYNSLRAAFEDLEFTEVCLPRRYTSDIFSRILAIVEN